MIHIEDYYMKNELNRYREFVNGFIKLATGFSIVSIAANLITLLFKH